MPNDCSGSDQKAVTLNPAAATPEGQPVSVDAAVHAPSPASERDASMIPLVLAGSCAFMNLLSTQPILPLLSEIFHASKLQVSLTVTAPSIAIVVAAPILGRVSDRWGRKRTMMYSAVLLAFATLLSSTAMSLSQLIFWRFLQGVFTPGVFSVTVAYVNEEWPAHRVGHAMTWFGMGGIIGSCFGRTMSGVLAHHLSWRTGFFMLGVVNLIWAVMLVKTLPKESKFVASTQGDSWFALLLDLLRNRALVATYFVGFCIMTCLMNIFSYVNFHLAAPPYNLNAAALGYIFLVYLVGGVVNPVAGRWIDRLGLRYAQLIACCMGACGILMTLAEPLWVIVAGLAVFGSACFLTNACANSHVGRCVEHSQALAAGLYGAAYYLGGCVGSVVPAFIWELGGWTGCVLFALGVQVLSAMSGFFFWTRGRIEQPNADALSQSGANL